MEGKRSSAQQIVQILREAEGADSAREVIRRYNITEQTFLPVETGLRRDGQGASFNLFLDPIQGLTVDGDPVPVLQINSDGFCEASDRQGGTQPEQMPPLSGRGDRQASFDLNYSRPKRKSKT